MEKKTKRKGAESGLKLKKGEKYACDACGMVVTVDKSCGCDPCDIICCGNNMKAITCCQ